MSRTYLIASDIHGALSGAQMVEKAFAFFQPDYILLLGDILYHGPRNAIPEDYAPKQVIEIMNRMSDFIIAVRGNCDAEVDQMVLDFECLRESNEIPYKNHKIFMSHGHIFSPDHLPKLRNNDIFLSGHTHIPTAKKKNEIFLLNPGSVSLPKENHPATFGIIQDGAFTVYTKDNQKYMSIDL